jgi:hypothetical protein
MPSSYNFSANPAYQASLGTSVNVPVAEPAMSFNDLTKKAAISARLTEAAGP